MGTKIIKHVLNEDGHAVVITVAEIIALTVISWKQDRQKFVGNVNNNLIVWLLEDLHAVDIPSERIVVDDRIRQFLQAYIIVVFHSAGPQTNCRFYFFLVANTIIELKDKVNWSRVNSFLRKIAQFRHVQSEESEEM